MVFKALLRRFRVDGIFDVGSCDGFDSLIFRQVLPDAKIVAFEANPINFEKMMADPQIRDGHIEVLPYAITNTKGIGRFNITEANYDSTKDNEGIQDNRGISSLLQSTGTEVRKVVDVETHRLDEFVVTRCPEL